MLVAIEKYLLVDALAGLSELSLAQVKKGKDGEPLPLPQRKAYSVYDVLAVFAKNLVDTDNVVTGEKGTFASRSAPKKLDLIQQLETMAGKYGIHISRAKKSWMASYFMTRKCGAISDGVTRQAKRKQQLQQAEEESEEAGDEGDEEDVFDSGDESGPADSEDSGDEDSRNDFVEGDDTEDLVRKEPTLRRSASTTLTLLFRAPLPHLSMVESALGMVMPL
ncbi:hypothetical protein BC941DRAFT_441487 [Chlamydoabsidia padenii]|nr:hypothetical protein BC941DRAFT_441487 [Chlamydoabsidia padenii]